MLFDAIEFDPVIATTDILYDLAFPIMDFVSFRPEGLREPAVQHLSAEELDGKREGAAAVAAVPVDARRHPRQCALHQTPLVARATRTTSQKRRPTSIWPCGTSQPVRPSLIAIGGKSGTGKSVLAREAAALMLPLPGAVVLRSDVIRKELFGVDPLIALPEAAYSQAVTERVYRELLDRARQVIDQGFSAIIDAAFLRESERNELSVEAHES